MATQLDTQLQGIRARYDRDGYVIVRQAIDKDLVHEARNHITWLMRKHPDLRPEQLGHTLMTDDPFWVRLVADHRLLDIATEFVGPDIALFASHYIAKPPRDGQPVLWHQDGAFWPLEPMAVVTLWLAVDDSTVENGCMRVIPGTHTLDLVGLRERTDTANVLSAETPPEYVDEAQAVDVELEAGDVSIHHPNIIHGSNANVSPRWRRGLTIRYIPTGTRILTDTPPWPSAFLLRGAEAPGVNAYNSWPRYQEGVHMPFRGCEAWQEAQK
ncbi:MAG: phytanoyl-CoA dioxygenase family protein [Anaerolineae bacterium]|nr:phytanoyl-CoA dioxygenase family protein [Anaerolineae bacterium]